MKKNIKKESEIVAFSLRLPKKLYEKLSARAVAQKRSVNKESEIIFEKDLA